MKMRAFAVVVAVVAVGSGMLAGCANVTVTAKRGAGPGSMRTDEDACRQTSTTEAAYAACLREKGWMVAGKGTGPDAAEVKAKKAAAATAPSATKPVTGAASTAPAVGKGGAPAPAVPAIPTNAVSESVPPPSAPQPAAKAKAETAPPANDLRGEALEPAAEADAAAEPLDPLTKIDVASWWKFGGTASDLDRAMAACAKKLGDAHAPGPGGTIVTVGMRDCLREAGWRGLGHSGK